MQNYGDIERSVIVKVWSVGGEPEYQWAQNNISILTVGTPA